ncbi:MAG: hypothetical protein J6J21_02890 [Clostridia bacterium]|nr:hypothetical protein [Clostridia bacterium]
MKIRTLCLVLALILTAGLFVACTGDVPEPYEQDAVLAEANINTKIVVQEEGETPDAEPTEIVLLEKVINVTSTTRTALMLKDLINTLDDEGHIPVTLVYNRITAIENYEANDTHMWFWSLEGNSDQPLAVQIQDGDTVVLTYAKKGAELLTDEAGNVLKLTTSLNISAGKDQIYKGEYSIEGENSISVKEILKRLRDEEGAFQLSVAGSIKSINDYAKDDTHEWVIYVDDEVVKPSAKVKDGDTIKIVYETVEADEK